MDTDLITINTLSDTLNEVSGITMLTTTDQLFAINDSGNTPTVYKLSTTGKIVDAIKVPDATNIDWEDITYDQQGNLYIGDFGNNFNDRKDLAIYTVSGITTSTIQTTKTEITLSDQNKFPPSKKNRNYDIEAFIFYKGNFYLFTKNRSSKFDGTTKMYRVLAKPGKQIARLVDTFSTCNDPHDCFVTGAAINNKGNKIALLTYDKIFLLEDFTGDHFFNSKITKLSLDHYSQKEGIAFKNDTILCIVDEKRNARKAKLYEYKLP